LKYMQKTQHPGKWCGTLFNVVLHWYECIKEYMWLKLIGLLPTQNLCLMQSAFDDIVLLEYMQQLDHSDDTCSMDSLTYLHAQARNPICSNHKSMDPECDYKVVTDDPNVIIHATDLNQFVSKQSDDTLPQEEQNTFI
jgi:hypothetical protein